MDFKSFEDINKMTFEEYEIAMKAARLKQVDLDYRNHLQAFLNFAAQATKKSGKNKLKPVYSKFAKFFNFEEAEQRAKHGKENNKMVNNYMQYLKERRETDEH